MGKSTPLRAESPLHKPRRLYPIPPALKGRIKPRKEIVQVRSDDAHPLLKGGRPAAHDEREGQHSPREVFDGDLDDDEGYAFAAVVGGVGVG